MSVAVDLDRRAADLAASVTRQLQETANRGGSEADFRREAARILDQAAAAAGLTIAPRDEYSVASGRVDSVYNRFVLEYKRPGVLGKAPSHRGNVAVIEQVKNYILDVAKRERREVQRLAGVATDGHYLIFVRRIGEGWSDPEIYPVNGGSVERLLRLLFSLAVGAALVPENLVEDFGPRTWRAQKAVRALYRGLHSAKDPLVGKLFEQWRLFFSEATDYKEWAERIEGKEEFRSFVKGMGLDPKFADAPRVFFALHTYYALLIKLVASLAAARFAGAAATPLSELAAMEGGKLQRALANLERGGLFREYGIRNFLEGDFFGWYLTGWDDNVEEAVRSLIQRLAEYDPGTLELAPENARDLLKKLYHYLLPREIRHDLGEYYTPDWLAERLIIQTLGAKALGDATKRVLDPSCGSGTFLVILIKYIKERAAAEGRKPAETLKLILSNVVGIDLNPLAVIAARTNYLFALGDLLKARPGDIDIPVYQADSVLTPSAGSGLFEGKVCRLKTAAGIFPVPVAFATQSRMDTLASILDEAVEASSGDIAFIDRLTEEVDIDVSDSVDELATLYRQLYALHEQGLNGVWARIIKNAFSPLFLDHCDYIVGNPPWVNWESLPDEYRIDTKPLWEHYGLFPHSGMDTILGKGKKDLCMLMTYVAIDRYLRKGGRLGFVITESVFKNSGASQGFRRFRLPDGTPFGPVAVEDMVSLTPFEGAANRTAILIVAKGKDVRYPVPYSQWYKRLKGRGSAIGFDTPYASVTSEKIGFRAFQAEPVDSADPTSSWLTGRAKAVRSIQKLRGPSEYVAREGANTGGANAVFWVEQVGKRPGDLVIVANVIGRAKKRTDSIQAAIEPGLLYPLVRSGDLRKWQAKPEVSIILAQDPRRRSGVDVSTMREKYPKTYGYLHKFETQLRARAAYRRYFDSTDPFWSMFNIGEYTLGRWKVVWQRMGSSMQAAVCGVVAGKPIIPQETLCFVNVSSKEEAHYLCAALNSAPFDLAVGSYSQKGGKSFASPHILQNLRIPTFASTNRAHVALVELSQAAHEAAEKSDDAGVLRIESEIDRAAGKLWQLSDDELSDVARALRES